MWKTFVTLLTLQTGLVQLPQPINKTWKTTESEHTVSCILSPHNHANTEYYLESKQLLRKCKESNCILFGALLGWEFITVYWNDDHAAAAKLFSVTSTALPAISISAASIYHPVLGMHDRWVTLLHIKFIWGARCKFVELLHLFFTLNLLFSADYSLCSWSLTWLCCIYSAGLDFPSLFCLSPCYSQVWWLLQANYVPVRRKDKMFDIVLIYRLHSKKDISYFQHWIIMSLFCLIYCCLSCLPSWSMISVHYNGNLVHFIGVITLFY